jgi:hypothetical protein
VTLTRGFWFADLESGDGFGGRAAGLGQQLVMAIDLLVDGKPRVQVNSPLIDVDVSERPWNEPVRRLAIRVSPAVLAATLAVIVVAWALGLASRTL